MGHHTNASPPRTSASTPRVVVTVPCPPLSWVVDDRPWSEWAHLPRGVEHAVHPAGEHTLCGRGVEQFLRGTPAHPHTGQLTLCPRWPASDRCRECARRAAPVFTLQSGHIFDGTRARPLCGRRNVAGRDDTRLAPPGPGTCRHCQRSLLFVTRWRTPELAALRYAHQRAELEAAALRGWGLVA